MKSASEKIPKHFEIIEQMIYINYIYFIYEQ